MGGQLKLKSKQENKSEEINQTDEEMKNTKNEVTCRVH